ncbi:MAG: type II secretion system GspH family protein [Desulfobulbus sp.]|jgi:general secretion pathway protein J|uniref:PulJ/GspJ family protein n=1 Tax=Desulfobulbus sp. TaxID=895 RepID=UPI00284C6831|nr:type II secretion system protein [Desulfobulbus sp.]MDR2548858.1 type II secretion system GspH family protein [Desulfobulbus sp.]
MKYGAMTMRNRGFTLLELLLAITVLGVVMAMLGLSLTSTMRVVEATEKEEEVYFLAQTAMRRITEDLASAISNPQALFIGQNNTVRDRRADSLDFASQARLILNPDKQKAGIARIRYQLLADRDDERIWKLLRSETLILPNSTAAGEPADDEGADPAFLLADSLRAVEFRYYDRDGQEFDSWREVEESGGQPKTGKDEDQALAGKKQGQAATGKDDGQVPAKAAKNQAPVKGGKLPAAVQCTLEFWTDPDKEGFQAFTTRVLIPVEPEDAQ